MALRNLVYDGDPMLGKMCRPVTKFDERLAVLLDDMAETMLEYDGLGLAASQVGVLRRVFVAAEESTLPPPRALREEDETGEVPEEELQEPVILEFINPEIVEVEGDVRAYEGCLSFPGQFAAIGRPARAVVRAFDRDGKPFTYVAEGMMARCVCHETDHLNGVTIPDLAEYFYDPNVPHDLDETLGTRRSGNNDAEDEAQTEDSEA